FERLLKVTGIGDVEGLLITGKTVLVVDLSAPARIEPLTLMTRLSSAGHLPRVMIELPPRKRNGQILVLANEPAHTAMNAQTITAAGREGVKDVRPRARVDSAAHTHQRM